MARLFLLLSASFLFFFVFFHNASAQNMTIEKDSRMQVVKEDVDATQSAETSEVEYTLAYPGMLPDNPLYFLKTLRDAIVKFLINDPLKRSEFSLLTSDKRIYASVFLIEEEKDELALETLSKSNNYLHEAVFSLKNAQSKKKNINSLRDRMETAVKKHKEVVSRQILPHVSGGIREGVEKEMGRLNEIEKSVIKLAPKQ